MISEHIGDGWITDLTELKKLEKLAGNGGFQNKFFAAKQANKQKLASTIKELCQVEVHIDSMFDVQVKRIHEYKRQLLNALHVIALYHRIVKQHDEKIAPRTVIFAGKAAPAYWKAKLIIKFINSIADVVNNDPRVGNLLKVVFIPNYGVSTAEKIIPAADLSEQISTAGTEASGTGNMKFSLNGALTVGTLDGANVEIKEEVGSDNIFIFGLTAEEAEWEKRSPKRLPQQIYEANGEIRHIIDAIRNGCFCKEDKGLFLPLVDDLMNHHRDPYLHLIDLEEYLACQRRVGQAYLQQAHWREMAILNVARMGKFSSDRTIKEYAEEIWGISTPSK